MISLDGLVTVLPGNTHTPLGGRYHLTDWYHFFRRRPLLTQWGHNSSQKPSIFSRSVRAVNKHVISVYMYGTPKRHIALTIGKCLNTQGQVTYPS